MAQCYVNWAKSNAGLTVGDPERSDVALPNPSQMGHQLGIKYSNVKTYGDGGREDVSNYNNPV